MRLQASLLVALCAIVAPHAASAEIVTLRGGGVLSVSSYQDEGDSILLALRGGGSVRCPRSEVVEIRPDEVPRPEPVPPAQPEPAAVEASGSLRPYADLIDRISSQHGVDRRLVHAVVQVESGYNASAVSRRGAVGLMQLMPATSTRFAVSDPYDPAANLDGGVRYLKQLLTQFSLPLALAAYNAGENAVVRFRGIPPYTETVSYVRQVLALAPPARR